MHTVIRSASFALLASSVALAAHAGQATLVAAADTTIYDDAPTYSNGAGSYLFAGENAFSGIRRALLRFDVAAAVPAGATITSVQLTIHVSQTGSGSETHALHRVSASWGEGLSDAPGAEGQGVQALANDATWIERFFGASQPWSNAGGDFQAAASTTTSIGGIATYTFPSTPAFVLDAQDMLDHPAANHGWILRGNETLSGTAKRFDGRHGTDATLVPKLVVDFTPPCPGPSAYCVAAPNSAGSAGAQIGWSGSQSLGANAFTLTVSGTPNATTGMFFFGPGQAQVPFGDGLRCVTSPFRRLALQGTLGGAAQRTLQFLAPPTSDITAGSTWNFQFLYRDSSAGGAGFNLSNGLSATFCP